MTGFRDFPWHRHRVLTATLLLAGVLTLVFGIRLAESALRWSERRDPPIAAWMTLGFIERSWDVDRAVLAEALGVEIAPGERLTLAAVAERTGKPPAEVKATVERTIAAETTPDTTPAGQP